MVIYQSIFPSPELFKWTLVTSIVFHLIIVLGISFVMPERNESIAGPPLRITLVTHSDNMAPEDSYFLAPVNNRDGQDIPEPNTGTLILPQQQKTTHIPGQQHDNVLTSSSINPKLAQVNPGHESSEPSITPKQLRQEINIAYLNALAAPREKYISSKTREDKYVGYIENWRLMVERIGNLNYPDAAKQLKLEGDLVLDVALNANGHIQRINILRSSGQSILDDAAERIVHLAAPFERFPESFANEIDILHIVRTWKFVHDRLISTYREP